MEPNDLSEYEKIRLENIKRNALFLSSLGLGIVSRTETVDESNKNNDIADHIKTFKKSKVDRRRLEKLDTILPTRSSKRLKGFNASVDLPEESIDTNLQNVETSENKGVDYDSLPESSEELDDFEFEIYVSLKKWRLKRCRELDIEPYKIFQNKTLCELIRLRRNTELYATGHNGNNTIEQDLLECWGIGPKKVESGGFGFEAVTQMDENEDLFKKSRELSIL